ncbi:hypothetical protein [Lysobacter capsici]|uniref:hypothetical protein n=3 Tax=Lysobacter capsici TaxID=435897 RepID=UPI00287B84F8|nr:hypothetical protein [Lysobacter capsici]WND80379.1 hypothetical protein RJ610_24410 [Lysobacter capsici]WND85576.1 hypothetical protein RJ609_24430 [Lysobacter capsici]
MTSSSAASGYTHEARFFLLALAFAAMSISPASRAGEPVRQTPDDPRIASFKERIDFDRKIGYENASEHVVIDPAAMDTPPQLRSWSKSTRDSMTESGMRYIRMLFELGEQGVRIVVRVYDPRRNSAGEDLLNKADAVNTMTINDVPGPADLGTVSLRSPETPPWQVYWIFRNVFAEVTVYKTSISSIDIARLIQAELARNVRTQDKIEAELPLGSDMSGMREKQAVGQ